MMQLFGHEGAINAIAFSSDGRYLASGGDDGRVLLWEPGRTTEARELPLPSADPSRHITTLAFQPDGPVLVMGRDGARNPRRAFASIGWWELPAAEACRDALLSCGPRSKMAFDPSNGSLITAFIADHVRVIRSVVPGFISEGVIHHYPSRANRPILLATAFDCVVVGQVGTPMVNLSHISGMTRTLWCDRPYGAARGFALHPDGRLILATPGALLIWPTDDVHAVATPVPVESTPLITSVALSPDGMTLALGRVGGQVQQLDTMTWKVRDTFGWAVGDVLDLAFAPDGFRVAAAGDTGEIIIWDVE